MKKLINSLIALSLLVTAIFFLVDKKDLAVDDVFVEDLLETAPSDKGTGQTIGESLPDQRAVKGTLVLRVEEKVFDIGEFTGKDLYSAMDYLRSSGELKFESIYFDGLGYFIKSIDGIKNGDREQRYWTLYVNEKLSALGASDLILNKGDRVEWLFENEAELKK